MRDYFLYTDGGSRGNPGPSAAGIVLLDPDKKVIKKGGKYLGKGTNNLAEYQALILGLKIALELGIKNLVCFLDSELLVKQLNGLYKVKSPNLIKSFADIKKMERQFDYIKYEHVKREKNSEADAMVNLTLDKFESKSHEE